MEDDEDWVMVGRQREKDLWNPSSYIEGMHEKNKALKVRFNVPAEYWTDAFPVGNGRLGAMVWGGVLSETINLNGNYNQLLFKCVEMDCLGFVGNCFCILFWIFG